ncbi:hypothetical protein I7X12_05660 [Halosimplex litoreum]|uniref:Uncharacterized protein n=1 Tax=Halosimplex litoreum TaxID=1198301 RepID=A0A7T3G0L1_9EURY|nr:hypothetical protein [Halosimplex litoreum]QPV64111.1 hypothetical protein I7X12_05660 [Halosimplex litoreum]
MEVEILGQNDTEVGVEIFDGRQIGHVVHVGWDGEIKKHYADDYPKYREGRTFEQQRIMTQVEARAKLAAQREFPEAEIVNPEWIPEEVERGIEALQTMHVDDFAEQFETCYEMVTAPERFEDVTEETAQIITQPYIVDEDNDIEFVPTPIIQYRKDGEVQTTHRDSRMSKYDTSPGYPAKKFTITLPPMEFREGDYEFPDGFQVFLVEHMMAKIRDIYRHVGEEPPEPYADIDEELPGKLLTTEDKEYYDDDF